MKTKIFLILIMILFAVSCAKNNPANPVSSSNDLGNTSGVENNSNNDNNEKNNNIKDGNIDNTKNDILPDDFIIESNEPVKYKLNVTHIVETLDKVGISEEKINIDVYIYEDTNDVFLFIPRGVAFHDVKKSNGKYEATLQNSNGTYILSMTVSGDTITYFNLTIHGNMEKYYYKLQ